LTSNQEEATAIVFDPFGDMQLFFLCVHHYSLRPKHQ